MHPFNAHPVLNAHPVYPALNANLCLMHTLYLMHTFNAQPVLNAHL